MTSNKYLTSYHRIETPDDINEGDEELPPDPLIHVVPKSDQTRWNHIEDLDSFFTRVYQYHQHSGFFCKMAREAVEIIIFVFIIVFTTFLIIGINYDYFFKNKLPPGYSEHHKVLISDCIRSPNEMLERINKYIIAYIVLSSFYFIFKIFYFVVDYTNFREIQKFYNLALGIKDEDLEDITWEEVQHRVMEVQVEQRMCIHKESLTELDIYHRILRYENYFIAMVNKNIIPLKVNVPILGEITFLTRTLRYNINCILFYSYYFAPFENWRLKDEYKRAENRHRLAANLSNMYVFYGILNFVCSPFILALQILYSIYRYVEIIKREPSKLANRRWSCFGEVSLRHYNELDHELQARLNRGYRSAVHYMNGFGSPSSAIGANLVSFICSAIFAVLAILTIYDEDVIQVEHVITLMSFLAIANAICRPLIPDENLVRCPEVLMTRVLAEIHYLPESWKDRAHTSYVRNEFAKYFQLTFVHLLEALISPIMTPYMLCFPMRKKTLEIVDFLRNFTVEVQGVGDICSFAQMDIRRHGSRTWHPRLSANESSSEAEYSPPTLTDNGKTELSLLHFSVTNPNWKPPQDSAAFLHQIRKNARMDFNELAVVQENSLIGSINSVSLGGLGHMNITQRWLNSHDGNDVSVSSRVSHMEGSRHIPSHGILGSLVEELGRAPLSAVDNPQRKQERECLNNLLRPLRPQDMVAADMCVSALYLHDFHHKRRAAENYLDQPVYFEQQHDNVQQQQPAMFHGFPPSNISESCYNSSDPPSVDEILHLTSHDLPSISRMPFPQSMQQPNTSSISGINYPPQSSSSQNQWNTENNTPPDKRT